MTISCSGFLKNSLHTQHLELFRKCNPSNSTILNYDKGGGDHTFIPKHGVSLRGNVMFYIPTTAP